MQAIIMAAGRGTRLQTLNSETSKHMLPIAPGKPILSHTVDILPGEIDEVIFVVNHLREHIQNYFGSRYGGRRIKYALQKELNGTGGAVHVCKNLVNDNFIVVSGDDIYHPEDIKKVAQCDSYCILVHEPPAGEEIRAAVIETNGDNTIKRIVEYPDSLKSESRLINTALYKLEKNFFDYPLVPISSVEYGLPQTLVTLAKDFPINIVTATFWQVVNTPEDFARAQKLYPKLARDINK